MAWEDNFNKLVEKSLPINEKKEWRFTMEEHKTKGTMQFGIRAFNVTGNYIGPTKNGMIIGIESEEQIEAFRKSFNEFIDEVKGML